MKISSQTIRDYFYIFLGTVIQAIALQVFLVPANIATAGISGISQIIHSINGWPIGLMVLVGNIPLFILGWRFMGGAKFAFRTIFSVIIFSIAADTSVQFLPPNGVTDDILLNTLYGAVISGFGYALVYRGQGSSGGTDILGRIIVRRWGIPLSQTYMITDSVTMLLAGLSFGWTNALYSIVMLYISGVAAETFSQGSRVVRTAMIVTSEPQKIGEQIIEKLGRGVTKIPGTGMYTGEERTILYCVVGRSEVQRLKRLVAEIDPKAFLVIGQASEALGEGFYPIQE